MEKLFKSLVFLILSGFTIYFLNGLIPKIINLLDDGLEKTFCITFYWLALLSIIVLPQYFVWFTDDDINLLSPFKSMVTFSISILAIVGVSLITDKIFNALTLSTTSGMIYAVCFWLFAILVMYVPQVFVYEPLKEKFT